MKLTDFFGLLGGLALFLYGMHWIDGVIVEGDSTLNTSALI